MSLRAELDLAKELARTAGQALLSHFDTAETADPGAAAAAVDAADQASYDHISSGLIKIFPDDALLSEETKDATDRFTRARCWIIDPLDGTQEFLTGTGEFSVLIGLAIEGRPRLGVIYHPASDSLYWASEGEGAYLDRGGEVTELEVSPVATTESMVLVASRSHRDARINDVQYLLGIGTDMICGSVGLKVGLLAERRCDLYVHPSGHTKAWDTCAAEALLVEAGGMITDCYGAPLKYSSKSVLNHRGVIASNGRAHEQIVDAAVRAIRGELDDDLEE